MKFISIFSLCIVSASAFSPSVCRSSNSGRISSVALDAVSRRDALAWMPAAVAFVAMPKDASAAKASTTKEKKAETSTATPTAANAAAATTPYLGSVAGVFDDPKHPKGYRVIIAKQGVSSATMELKDDPKGTQFIIPVKVKTDKKAGVTVGIDFSVKGGPKDIVGVVAKNTITFPDGNVWKKQSGIVGVYSDPQHPKGYRVIRKESGSTVTVELNNNNMNKPAEALILAAKTGSSKKTGSTISIPFPGKNPGETNTVVGTLGDDFITFPDGNKWTKL